MIWCSTCWCTVGFSTGVITSTRRSRLRGIQSAERDEHARLVGGHRLAVGERDDAGVLQKPSDDALYTDVFGQPRTPGRRQQMPRITSSIGTPAQLAA